MLHCAELHRWVSLQARCILAPPDVRGKAYVYQLGLYGCYIGQGLIQRRSSIMSGASSRWREHARCYYRLRTQRGDVPDSARYVALLTSNRMSFLPVVFITLASVREVTALESSYIVIARPVANNLSPSPSWTGSGRVGKSPRLRRGRRARRLDLGQEEDRYERSRLWLEARLRSLQKLFLDKNLLGLDILSGPRYYESTILGSMMSLCAGKLCRASHVDRWTFAPPLMVFS